jgi:hypothetical protein
MGMNYHLEAENGDKSTNIELSAVGYLQLKRPDEAEGDLTNWIAFVQKHSGQKIKLVDGRGAETDPAHVTGGYILGIQPYDPTWPPGGVER